MLCSLFTLGVMVCLASSAVVNRREERSLQAGSITYLYERLQNLETTVVEKLSSLESKMSTKIDSNIANKLNTVESKISTKIDQNTNRIQSRVDAMETKLSSSVSRNSDRISNYSDQITAISTGLQQIDHTVNNLEILTVALEPELNNMSSQIVSAFDRRYDSNKESITVTLNKILDFWNSHFCLGGFAHYDLSCYKVVGTKMSWENAENHCKMYGAHLVDFSTVEEHAFLKQLIAREGMTEGDFWTGGKWNGTAQRWRGATAERPLSSLMGGLASTRYQVGPSTGSYPVRLVNGNTPNEGRVEIYVGSHGGWGIVCDDSWDINDARVVCRQLGFDGAISAPQRSRYGYGNGQHRMDDVVCTGTEPSLDRCRHNGWNDENCGNSEAAGVVCRGLSGARAYNGSVPQTNTTSCLMMDGRSDLMEPRSCQDNLNFICKI